MFTLSGGHVFPLYDAATSTGTRIVDVRHEQSAVFAAEAVAKLQRRPGLAVLTAGPGVTNGISGMTSALLQRLAGGRARRPGAAVPLGLGQPAGARPPAARPRGDQARGDDLRHRRRRRAHARPPRSPRSPPHRGPVFVDLPIEVIFSQGEATLREAPAVPVLDIDPDEIVAGGRVARGGTASGDHRRLGRLRRRRDRGAAGGGRDAADPGLRQRHGPRLRCRRSTRSRSPARGGPRCPGPTWSRSSARRWTSGSDSGISARPRLCTWWTHRPRSRPT